MRMPKPKNPPVTSFAIEAAKQLGVPNVGPVSADLAPKHRAAIDREVLTETARLLHPEDGD